VRLAHFCSRGSHCAPLSGVGIPAHHSPSKHVRFEVCCLRVRGAERGEQQLEVTCYFSTTPVSLTVLLFR
jgi:hypothetical protein